MLLLTGTVLALPVNQPGEHTSRNGLVPAIKILQLNPDDPDYELPLPAIVKRLGTQPVIRDEAPNFGFSDAAFWIGFKLNNPTRLSQHLYIELAYSLLDHVYFVVQPEDQTKPSRQFTTGDARPFSHRPLNHPNFVLPVTLDAGETVSVFIRVETTSSSQFPLRIWTADEFGEYAQSHFSVIGALIGMIAVMAIYNLILFLSLRDKGYLYFALTLAGYAILESVLTGYGYQFFWPEQVSWNASSLAVSANVALASLLLFSKDFLQLQEHYPGVSRAFSGLSLAGFVLAAAGLFLPYQTTVVPTSVNVVLSPLVSYCVAIYLSFKGYKPGRYYSLAFTFYVIAALAFALSKMGIIPRNFLSEYAIHFSAVSVVVLLSFAMADRIHSERRIRERAQHDAIENLQKYRAIYEKSLEGMFRVLPNGNLIACNPAFARLLGAENEASLISIRPSIRGLLPASKKSYLQLRELLEKQGHIFGFETKCKRLDGSEFWGAIFVNLLEDSQHKLIVEGSIVDITDKKENELQLSYLASHDPLTNLINRVEFEKRMRRAVSATRTGNISHALVFIDLDQFKIVNDTSGHVAGDELLKQVGALMSKHLRDRDSLARMGGDEFALLLNDCSLDDATEIANRLRNEIVEYRFVWGSNVFNVGASIGIVAITAETSSVEEAMSLADTACYAAKDAGRNRVIVHSQSTNDLTARQNEMQVATGLVEAIKQDQLVLFFQNIGTTRKDIRGRHYELLVRMKKDGRLLAPGAFLPAAERYNMIRALDRWVITNYFSWLSHHPQHLQELYQANINLSSQTIGEADFESFLQDSLNRFNIPAERICFEVTETMAISNMVDTVKFMERMRRTGLNFALDDFGSGFSSYSYLKTLPVNAVKIDGAFIRDILVDPVDMAMVRSITEVAHLMDLQVVAEFVETAEIQTALEDIGVDFLQGYHLHIPEPLIGSV